MTRSLRCGAAALLLLACGLAAAQPASGVRCPMGASAPASADCPMGGPMHDGAGGMGAGMGPGAMHDGTGAGTGRMRMRMGEDDTPGWSMMSAAERRQHRDRLRSMTSHADCQAYMTEHHAQMQARAQAQGRSLPDRPRRDACARLKPAKP